MARIGTTIENPISGERITWVSTAKSSDGTVLAFDLALQPDAAVSAEHRHVRQEERFVVTRGKIAVAVAGEERVLEAGDEATVAPGVAHRWWNVDAGESIVRVELRPALRTEVFFETFFGLARDGKTNSHGIPGVLHIAAAYRTLSDSCPRLTRPPLMIQRLVLTPLVPLARLMRRRAVYREYSPDSVS